jgi:hypothetical protein
MGQRWYQTSRRIYSMDREIRIMNSYRFSVHKRLISADKIFKFVSDRMAYIILRDQ